MMISNEVVGVQLYAAILVLFAGTMAVVFPLLPCGWLWQLDHQWAQHGAVPSRTGSAIDGIAGAFGLRELTLDRHWLQYIP